MLLKIKKFGSVASGNKLCALDQDAAVASIVLGLASTLRRLNTRVSHETGRIFNVFACPSDSIAGHGMVFLPAPYGFTLSTSADPIGITGDWMG